jgi:hypothetical protein
MVVLNFFTAETMKTTAFWNAKQLSPVDIYKISQGNSYLNLQDNRMFSPKMEAEMSTETLITSTGVH